MTLRLLIVTLMSIISFQAFGMISVAQILQSKSVVETKPKAFSPGTQAKIDAELKKIAENDICYAKKTKLQQRSKYYALRNIMKVCVAKKKGYHLSNCHLSSIVHCGYVAAVDVAKYVSNAAIAIGATTAAIILF